MSSSPSPRRRPSKAAALRHSATLQAAAETPNILDPSLAAIVAGFDVSRYGPCSQDVHAFLLDAITASRLTGKESVRKHCRHLTALAVFCDQQGLPLTIAAVLTTERIDDFVRRGMHGASTANQAERRRRLLCLARVSNPGPTTPARLTPIGHRAVKPPYTPAEWATIRRAAATQPTQRNGEQLAAVVALGFGAGADSVDLRQLWIRDITDRGPGGLLVQFHGPRPRLVPVRRPLEDLLRVAIGGRAGDELVIGQQTTRRNTAARIIDNAALYKVPHIEPARLRATWLIDLMSDPIPVAVILKAAGLLSARTLTDLVPHAEPWRAHKRTVIGDEQHLMRGGAR